MSESRLDGGFRSVVGGGEGDSDVGAGLGEADDGDGAGADTGGAGDVLDDGGLDSVGGLGVGETSSSSLDSTGEVDVIDEDPPGADTGAEVITSVGDEAEVALIGAVGAVTIDEGGDAGVSGAGGETLGEGEFFEAGAGADVLASSLNVADEVVRAGHGSAGAEGAAVRADTADTGNVEVIVVGAVVAVTGACSGGNVAVVLDTADIGCEFEPAGDGVSVHAEGSFGSSGVRDTSNVFVVSNAHQPTEDGVPVTSGVLTLAVGDEAGILVAAVSID